MSKSRWPSWAPSSIISFIVSVNIKHHETLRSCVVVEVVVLGKGGGRGMEVGEEGDYIPVATLSTPE